MAQSPTVTRSEIRAMFDRAFYQRGKTYYENGQVIALEQNESNPHQWNGKVRGKHIYSVTITIHDHDVRAICTCPAFANYDACKHVVAVLIALADSHKAKAEVIATIATANSDPPTVTAPPKPPATVPISGQRAADRLPKNHDPSNETVAKLMNLFRTSEARVSRKASLLGDDDSEKLRIEWHISVSTSYHESIVLTFKVGPKTTYVVRRIRDFLEAVNEGRELFFTPKFSYIPDLHRFHPADVEIFCILTDIVRDERNSRGTYSEYPYLPPSEKERVIQIPPIQWSKLCPLLARANATVSLGTREVPLRIEDTPPIPIHIASRDGGGYTVSFTGINRVVLMQSYGCVLEGTTFYPLDADTMEQIAGIKQIVGSSKSEEIPVPPDALSPLMNEVLPMLRHVGRVTVDKQITGRIVEAPLQPKLYLDWSKDAADALVVRIDFVYGDITLSPLASHSTELSTGLDDAYGAIVLRDRAGEDHILQMLERASFVRVYDQFVLSGEDDIYAFLFQKLVEFQSIAKVYTTSAVDARTKCFPSARTRLDINTETNWLEVSFDISGLDAIDIRAVLQSLVEKKKYHRLRDGSFIPLEQGAYAELGALLDDLAIAETDLHDRSRRVVSDRQNGTNVGVGGLTLRLPTLRALPLVDASCGQHVRLGKVLRQWLDDLRHPDNLDFPVPTELKATLREYQVFGFQWLKTLARYGFGGILADDMGLGKTIQSIAFLLANKVTTVAASPALIVCPASLTYNWLHEIETFAPSLKAVVVSGYPTDRQYILATAYEYDVLISSYPLLRRDAQDYAGQTFSTLILDEAQAVKNHSTQTAAAARAIQSEHRFALTGTPIENSLDDLWSIFHTVFPAIFGSHKSFSSLSPKQVAKRARPFILRRLKQDVLAELPDKIETLHTSELVSEQKKLYLAYLARLQQETIQGLAKEGFQKGKLRILAGLTRLRQVCCHPSLCVENYRDRSGKLDQLLELVGEYMGAGGRILIFSQFTSMLQIIQQELVRQGVEHFYLDGETPVKDRLLLCQLFNEGSAPVFLISLKAGGTGLNLTGADTVILYDLWWNPAVEQQAADRAHRIGQKRTVQVIRMVTQGTIEEKMYELQRRKRGLIDTVVQVGSDGFSALTEEDVRELLSLEQ